MTLDYSVVIDQLPYLIKASGVTLYISLLTLLLGVVIGIVTALCRLSKFKILSSIAFLYTWIIRGTPLMVQLFILYFGLPSMGIKLSSMTAGILGMAVNTGAYAAEIFRSGIEAVDPGQREAAKALGMPYHLEMIRVVGPQAAKICILPLVNQFIITVKNSSMVSLVTITELFRAGEQIIYATFRHFEVYTVIALLYLIMTSCLMLLASYIKRKLV